jgi:hypothetical protein
MILLWMQKSKSKLELTGLKRRSEEVDTVCALRYAVKMVNFLWLTPTGLEFLGILFD